MTWLSLFDSRTEDGSWIFSKIADLLQRKKASSSLQPGGMFSAHHIAERYALIEASLETKSLLCFSTSPPKKYKTVNLLNQSFFQSPKSRGFAGIWRVSFWAKFAVSDHQFQYCQWFELRCESPADSWLFASTECILSTGNPQPMPKAKTVTNWLN